VISRRTFSQCRRVSQGKGLAVFSPANIANMTLWLRGDMGITQGSGTVSAWADQSGAGNNFSQAVGNKQPTYVASAINSLPGMTFDGILNQLDGPALSALIANNAYTLFVALKPVTITNSSGTSYTNDCIFGEPGGYGMAYLDAGAGTPKAVAGNYVAADTIVEQNLVATTNAYIHAQRHTAGNLFVAVNNTAESSVASGNTGSLAGVSSIARGNGSGHYGNITVAEIIIYKVDLDTQNTGDRALVLNYLRTKYGTP